MCPNCGSEYTLDWDDPTCTRPLVLCKSCNFVWYPNELTGNAPVANPEGGT